MLSFGDALHHLLKNLNLPDHPERYAFKVLPVLPVAARLVCLEPKTLEPAIFPELTRGYSEVVYRSNRIRRLLELAAPPTVLLNEFRILQQSVGMLLDSRNSPIENRHGSLYDHLMQTKEIRARKWLMKLILTALRIRVVDLEIPIVSNPVEIKIPAVLQRSAKIEGTGETIPIIEVINEIRRAAEGIYNEIREIQSKIDLDAASGNKELNEEEIQKMQDIWTEKEAMYHKYEHTIKAIHIQAAQGKQIVVSKDNDSYKIVS